MPPKEVGLGQGDGSLHVSHNVGEVRVDSGLDGPRDAFFVARLSHPGSLRMEPGLSADAREGVR